jgi:hypothetical protein
LLTSSRTACERLDVLQSHLTRLKHELAQAWVSPDHSVRVPKIEHRIRQVWDQMDRLAVSLSEPITKVNRHAADVARGRAATRR